MPVKTAYQNVISKSGSNLKVIKTIIPFTTTINRPRVTIINGNESKITIGLSSVLAIEKISPAKINAVVLSGVLMYPVPNV